VLDTAPREILSADHLDSFQTLAKATMASLERWRAVQDHTQKQAVILRALDGMSRRFETLTDALPQLVWSSPPDGFSDYFRRQWCEFTGAPATDSYGTGWLDFLHPEDVHATQAAWHHAVATDSPYEIEYRLRNVDGAYRWMLARGLSSG
jgi:PAS domain S-box-containing protein